MSDRDQEPQKDRQARREELRKMQALDRAEAAEYLGISIRTMARIIDTGKVAAYQYGGTGRKRYRVEDLDALQLEGKATSSETRLKRPKPTQN